MKSIRIYRTAIAFLCAGLVVASGFAVALYRMRASDRVMLANVYERSFHEAVGYAAQVDNTLTKLEAVERPEQRAPLFAALWRQAASAHEGLSALPYTTGVTAEAQKYLAQVSDFAYTMLLKSIDGQALDGDDTTNLTNAAALAPGFADELTSILNQAGVTGGIRWESLADASRQTQDGEAVNNVPPEVLLGSLQRVTQPLQEAPGLLYDGPFSDHIQTLAPRLTKGKANISPTEGRNIVLDLLAAEAVDTVEFLGESAGETVIPVMSYAAKLSGESEPSVYIDITKAGGVPLWMLRPTPLFDGDTRITLSAAIGFADAFLGQAGFGNMKYSYYEYAEHCVVINYAPVEDGVVLYPDLVKVKVDMTDGTILGLEAVGYVMMHEARSIPAPRLSVYDALNYISPKLSVLGSQTALIPLGSYREVLCYEFWALHGETEFLIYINADTGRMEQIFEMVIGDYGVLVQ